MARVDPKPTYKLDICRRLMSWAIGSKRYVQDDVMGWVDEVSSGFYKGDLHKVYYAHYHEYDYVEEYVMTKENFDPAMSEDHLDDWAEMNNVLDDGKKYDMTEILEQILFLAPVGKAKYVGTDAVFEIIRRVLDKSIAVGDSYTDHWAADCAHAIMGIQALGSQLHPLVFEQTWNGSSWARPKSSLGDLAYYERAQTMGDVLATGLNSAHVAKCNAMMNPRIYKKKKMQDFAAKWKEVKKIDRWHVNHRGFVEHVPEGRVYNVRGIVIWKMDDASFVMTRDHCNLLRSRLRSIHLFARGSTDYRLSTEHVDLTKAYQKVYAAIATALRTNPEKVARAMHVTYYALVVEIAGGDPTALRAKAIDEHGYNFWAMLKSLRLTDRVTIDISKAYHLLPTPDIDIGLVYSATKEKLTNENPVDEKSMHDFIAFSKSFDLARFILKNRKLPKMAVIDGYSPADEEWCNKCLRGIFALPERENWGKASIDGEFTYVEHANNYIYEADDVTWVSSQLNEVFADDPLHASELLHAVFGPTVMSNGKSIAENRKIVFEGKWRDAVPVTIAGKAECTKSGAKVRATFSACDIFREIFSEVEKNLQIVAHILPGISLRANPVKLEKQFRLMSNSTKIAGAARSNFVSGDVSGWSDKMARALFYMHLRMLLGYFDNKGAQNVTDMWDRIVLVCNKRENTAWTAMPTGNFQGFPGTHDTIMHTHLLAYALVTARIDGIIPEDVHLWLLTLIDDMVGCAESKSPLAEGTKDRLLEHFRTTYLKMGFELDTVKTLVSEFAFIYLNRLFVDGAEVVTSLKTYCKIGMETDRIFSSVFERVESVAGTAAAAINAGSCPFSAYFAYLYCSIREIIRVCPLVRRENAAKAAVFALTPRSEGGWGMSSLLRLVTSEIRDASAHFDFMINRFFMVTTPTDVVEAYYTIRSRPLAKVSATSLLKDPFQTVYAGIADPASFRLGYFKRALIEKGPNEAYSKLLNLDYIDAHEEVRAAILKVHKLDAPATAEIFANMPDAMIDAIVSKIERSEIAMKFMKPAQVGSCLAMIRYHEVEQIMSLFRAPIPPKNEITSKHLAFMDTPPAVFTHTIREMFHAANGAKFCNSVYPDPLSILAHTEHDPTNDKVTRVTFDIGKIRTSKGGIEGSFVDSKTTNMPYYGAYTAGFAIYEGIIGRGLSRLDACVQRLAVLFGYIKSMGLPVGFLESYAASSWSKKLNFGFIENETRSFIGSLKRLPAAPGGRNHYVSAFKNISGAVNVDFRSTGNVIAQTKSHTCNDVFSSANALRAVALLEASVRKENYVADYTTLISNVIEYEDCGLEQHTHDDFDNYEYPAFDEVLSLPRENILWDQAYRAAAVKVYRHGGAKMVAEFVELIESNAEEEIAKYMELPEIGKVRGATAFTMEVSPDEKVFYPSAGPRPFRAGEYNFADFHSRVPMRRSHLQIDNAYGGDPRMRAATHVKEILCTTVQHNVMRDKTVVLKLLGDLGEVARNDYGTIKLATNLEADVVGVVFRDMGLPHAIAGLKHLGFFMSYSGNVPDEKQIIQHLKIPANRIRMVKIWASSEHNTVRRSYSDYLVAANAVASVAHRHPASAKIKRLRNHYRVIAAQYDNKATAARKLAARTKERAHNEREIYCSCVAKIVTAISFDPEGNVAWSDTMDRMCEFLSDHCRAYLKKHYRNVRKTPYEFESTADSYTAACVELNLVFAGMRAHYGHDEVKFEVQKHAVENVLDWYHHDSQVRFVSEAKRMSYDPQYSDDEDEDEDEDEEENTDERKNEGTHVTPDPGEAKSFEPALGGAFSTLLDPSDMDLKLPDADDSNDIDLCVATCIALEKKFQDRWGRSSRVEVLKDYLSGSIMVEEFTTDGWDEGDKVWGEKLMSEIGIKRDIVINE